MEPVSEFFSNVANIILLAKKKQDIECQLNEIIKTLKILRDDDERILKRLQENEIDEKTKGELLFDLEANKIKRDSFEERKYSKREMVEEMLKMLR